MKKDLMAFLYHLRIPATVEVMELPDADILPYTYERTLYMEERQRILQDLNISRRQWRTEPQSIMDTSHVRNFLHKVEIGAQVSSQSIHNSSKISNIMKNESSGSLSPALADLFKSPQDSSELIITTKSDNSVHSNSIREPSNEKIQQKNLNISSTPKKFDVTFADESNLIEEPSLPFENSINSSHEKILSQNIVDSPNNKSNSDISDSSHDKSDVTVPQPQELNLQYMNTSVRLNELIVNRSEGAELVVINLPNAPLQINEDSYMNFLEVLTDGLNKIIMIRGGGKEVITIF